MIASNVGKTQRKRTLLMACLVRQFPDKDAEPVSLEVGRKLIKDSLVYLSRCGAVAISEMSASGRPDEWGVDLKRLMVKLPDEDRPCLVPSDVKEHNFVETVNQCATMKRLLDAMSWAMTDESSLKESLIFRCHPTTSHAVEDAEDNDLMLVDGRGQMTACFEVSDVVSEKQDSNQKEANDLANLGVIKHGRTNAERLSSNHLVLPRYRCFLVVSSEFSKLLNSTRKAWRHGATSRCRFQSVLNGESTNIIEVLLNAPPNIVSSA